MKRLFVLSVFALLVGLCFMPTAPIQAADVDMKMLLSTNYGWSLDLPSSGFTCPEGRTVLPKSGLRFGYGWVCAHHEKGLSATVFWRTVKAVVVEESAYKEYLGGRSFAKECTTEVLPSAVDQEGVFTDCKLLISRDKDPTPATRHMAFYHFRAKVPVLPNGFSLVDNNGNLVESLGFTLIVTSGNTFEQVGGELRKLVGALRLAPVVHAAK